MSRSVSTTAINLPSSSLNRAGVDRQIQLIAELRHHAPVFGGKANAVVGDGVLGIELAQFVGPLQCDQIGQIALLLIECAPMDLTCR